MNGAWPAMFEHDADGLLTRAGALAVTRRASDGLISGTSVGVVTSTMSYDSHGELWKLRYEVPGGLLFQQELTRDSLGRIVRVAETGLAPRTIDYRHDAAGRLDRVAVGGVRQDSVGYDDNGNRVSWQGTGAADTASSTTDAQDRLLRYGAATYAHSADGELLRRVDGSGTTAFAYDALGSLVRVVLPGADTVRYRHDGLGRRVERRQRGTAPRRWLYGDAIPPVAELDSTDAVVARYVYGTWGHSPDLMLTPSAGHRVVSDHLGSVRMLVDTLTGAVVRHIERTARALRRSTPAASRPASATPAGSPTRRRGSCGSGRGTTIWRWGGGPAASSTRSSPCSLQAITSPTRCRVLSTSLIPMGRPQLELLPVHCSEAVWGRP